MTHDVFTTVEPGAGDVVWIGSFGTVYKVDSDATAGSVAVVEHVVGAGTLGAPMHRHANEDETSYVLEGALTIQVGDTLRTLTPGSIAVKPRTVWHTFWNATDEPVRFLEIISPGGFEAYFRELATIVSPDTRPDMDRIAALAARYGVEFDFDSVAELLERHELRLG
jgi:quercetin dioxygenase-like cupin family protein